jgi:hypothetical protein
VTPGNGPEASETVPSIAPVVDDCAKSVPHPRMITARSAVIFKNDPFINSLLFNLLRVWGSGFDSAGWTPPFEAFFVNKFRAM